MVLYRYLGTPGSGGSTSRITTSPGQAAHERQAGSRNVLYGSLVAGIYHLQDLSLQYQDVVDLRLLGTYKTVSVIAIGSHGCI